MKKQEIKNWWESELVKHPPSKMVTERNKLIEKLNKERIQNREYKVIRETLHDGFDKVIGKSVLLLQWSREADDVVGCIDDTTIYYTEEKESTSYAIIEWEAMFNSKDFAQTSFMNESQLIKNDK
tara:strand:+ start:242 stop:616 length:375 start_codon:yes stop_codon:yes gene_type:complete